MGFISEVNDFFDLYTPATGTDEHTCNLANTLYETAVDTRSTELALLLRNYAEINTALVRRVGRHWLLYGWLYELSLEQYFNILTNYNRGTKNGKVNRHRHRH